MRRFLAVLIVSSVALSGCSRLRDSRVNPINWFGKGRPGPVTTAKAGDDATANPLIPQKRSSIFRRNKAEVYLGAPIDHIVSVSIESLPSGAIIHVTGVSLRQGAHDVRLTSDSKGEPVNGVLSYTLEAVQPTNQPQGTQISRTIHAAVYVSNDDLGQSNVVRILGLRNAVSNKR